MAVTNGDNLADMVSLKDRFPLIKSKSLTIELKSQFCHFKNRQIYLIKHGF